MHKCGVFLVRTWGVERLLHTRCYATLCSRPRIGLYSPMIFFSRIIRELYGQGTRLMSLPIY